MSVYAILDVAISLALIYLALSIFCSAVKEWFSRWAELRAKTLQQSINLILQDPTAAGLAGEFHRHPLVTGLRFDKTTYPGYIPTETFAKALADIALELTQPAGAATTQIQVRQSVRASGGGAGVSAVAMSAESRRVLETLVRGNSGTLSDVEARLGKWFDDSMERASGWYKRKAQIIIVVIAAVLTIGLKVDSIAITKQIWVDPTLRETLVQQAQTVLRDTAGRGPAGDNAIRQPLADLEKQLPMGWTCWPWHGGDPGCTEWGPAALALTVPGLLLTIIALSLGAPFWFDLLNKLVNLRQTGVPPQEHKSA